MKPGSSLVVVLLAAGTALCATPAAARITRIEITTTERPTFGGYTWPTVGQYEKLVGKAYGEVDPTDRRNAVIVDLDLAPRNSRGNVDYSFNFYILKPIDLSKGAHRVMYEPPNRGGKTINAMNAYEVNIFDKRPDQTYRTGAIVDVAKPLNIVNTGGKWNTIDVTARGPRMTVLINGQKMVDVQDNKHARGPIALQYGAGTVKFKNVRLKTF